jgi:hypothetical protein
VKEGSSSAKKLQQYHRSNLKKGGKGSLYVDRLGDSGSRAILRVMMNIVNAWQLKFVNFAL